MSHNENLNNKQITFSFINQFSIENVLYHFTHSLGVNSSKTIIIKRFQSFMPINVFIYTIKIKAVEVVFLVKNISQRQYVC